MVVRVAKVAAWLMGGAPLIGVDRSLAVGPAEAVGDSRITMVVPGTVDSIEKVNGLGAWGLGFLSSVNPECHLRWLLVGLLGSCVGWLGQLVLIRGACGYIVLPVRMAVLWALRRLWETVGSQWWCQALWTASRRLVAVGSGFGGGLGGCEGGKSGCLVDGRGSIDWG